MDGQCLFMSVSTCACILYWIVYPVYILYCLLFVEQPLEQLPVYTCEDGEMVMSNSIARYVAKKFGKKNK